MTTRVSKWFDLRDLVPAYRQQMPVVLVNGLAEQSESWFANRATLSRHFDVKVPELLVYDGDSLHRRIDSGAPVDVRYLADRLELYLDEFVPRSSCNIVASSLGCQIALEVAVRRPDRVSKLVLIAPSGFKGGENLPVIDGVRLSETSSLVRSVFHHGRFASEELVAAVDAKLRNRKWKKGVLRTLRGTVGNSVAALLPLVTQEVLVIWGAQDRVLTDLPGAIRAAEQIRSVLQVVIARCGHAPQIERAGLVNRLSSQFLRDQLKSIPPDLGPERFLARAQEHATAGRLVQTSANSLA